MSSTFINVGNLLFIRGIVLAAKCRGVSTHLLARVTSAPWSISNLTNAMSLLEFVPSDTLLPHPLNTSMSGVFPYRSTLLTSSPACKNSFTFSKSPSSAAVRISGIKTPY
ncbi:hypothetical protein RVIR1_10580 [Candidatus Rickettsiella viridis]|uniref:Uncharacterized protein n=1 Tax=Candidatus Rickettsiella viridis TaxID=676208 RepID=A0A2Z5V7L0_9COXI|nr:hypothetical protein RVIR1_10580 [Candidatus Rickettsiella viridis]